MNGLSQCRTCGSQLVDGPELEHSGGSGRFRCTVRGIPTRVCSRGCSGAYWYWPDLGVEVLDALGPDSPNIAKRKGALFKTRHRCKHCNAELTDKHESAQFIFRRKLSKGTEIELIIDAPCLECTHCGFKYMPSQTSSLDAYYRELAEVIGEVITRDLIWK